MSLTPHAGAVVIEDEDEDEDKDEPPLLDAEITVATPWNNNAVHVKCLISRS
jgi:hypothetical protein